MLIQLRLWQRQLFIYSIQYLFYQFNRQLDLVFKQLCKCNLLLVSLWLVFRISDSVFECFNFCESDALYVV